MLERAHDQEPDRMRAQIGRQIGDADPVVLDSVRRATAACGDGGHSSVTQRRAA